MTPAPPRGAGQYGPGLLTLLLLPAGLLYIVLFGYPIGALLARSVQDQHGFTVNHFTRLFSQPLYLTILEHTLRVSLIVTAICVALGYPLAFWLTRLRGVAFSIAIACLFLPLWTSVLARIYAWNFLLQKAGPINRLLVSLHLIDAPLTLLYTDAAVITVMTHVLLPFMVLPVYAVINSIPRDLGRAAQSLGAGIASEFRHVLLPLSLPGLLAGSVMVFVIAMGYFIIPALVGGPRSLMISTLINEQIMTVLNWSFGAAISTLLLFAVLVVLALFARTLAVARRAEGGA
ncbi:MAG: ABC transporter permease [Acetobacteraceae bacterium]